MKISIETGDRDACLRPQVQENDTFVTLLWVLAMIGMIPVVIIIFILAYYNIWSPFIFLALMVVDIAVSAHLTWECRQEYIKEHGESA